MVLFCFYQMTSDIENFSCGYRPSENIKHFFREPSNGGHYLFTSFVHFTKGFIKYQWKEWFKNLIFVTEH